MLLENMSMNDFKKLIKESIQEKLAQLKEKSESDRKYKAQAIVDILNEEADTLDDLAQTARKMHGEKQFAELQREAEQLEKLRDAKRSRAEAVRSKYGLDVIDEKKKKPSAGMSKKEKSDTVKKARAGKDIGKKGKGFEKVAKAAGGGEKGTKVAAAAIWKQQAKK